MFKSLSLRLAATTLFSLATSCTAWSAAPLKVGLILPLSGPFSSYGEQIQHGVDLYLKTQSDTFAGRQVKLILKNDTGLAPDLSKRLAQELIIKDHVDILAGFAMTPGALATAPLATRAKIPMVVMNAGTSDLTEKSPYILRTSATVAQYTVPLGPWTVKHGMKRAITLVADFGPGHDAEKYFSRSYQGAGGKILDAIRVPVKNPDFAPFVQRIKDEKPDVVFLFLPAGESSVAFLKEFRQRGLSKHGIHLVATGDLTNEDTLNVLGDAALGIITAHHYAESHESPENNAYVSAYRKAYPDQRPNFMSVAGYDGMHLIRQVLEKTDGDATGASFMRAARGISFVSPRGPITIDKNTRDINQTIYIRQVERRDGQLENIEIDDSLKNYRDPGKN